MLCDDGHNPAEDDDQNPAQGDDQPSQGDGQNPADGDDFVTDEMPVDPLWQRRSFWVHALESARGKSGWVRVHRFYTANTAAQIASDLRSAHRRPPTGIRVKGVLPGERWDARWGVSPDGPTDQFAIWVRYLGRTDG